MLSLVGGTACPDSTAYRGRSNLYDIKLFSLLSIYIGIIFELQLLILRQFIAWNVKKPGENITSVPAVMFLT
jgi:hypothetical protein